MKILKFVLIMLLVILIVAVTFFQFAPPKSYDIPLPEIVASSDSSVIARGEYLVFGPAHCAGCHVGKGNEEANKRGERFPLSGGNHFETPLGNIYIPNITPDLETGIGNLSDGQIARSMRRAVNHRNHVMVPVMPFTFMSDEDVGAVISYLRAQPAVVNEVPQTSYHLFGKVMTRIFLKPYKVTEPIPSAVTPDTTAEYGQYLANSIANCKGCHSEFDMGKMEYLEPYYSGGGVFDEGGDFLFRPPNLTPDPETGHIYSWDETAFVERFTSGKVVEGSPMPWLAFASMSETDIRAIYRYLNTLEPAVKKIGPTIFPRKQ